MEQVKTRRAKVIVTMPDRSTDLSEINKRWHETCPSCGLIGKADRLSLIYSCVCGTKWNFKLIDEGGDTIVD